MDIQAAQSVHEKNAAYDNIIFVGNPEIPYNDICIRGEMLGLSVFQFEKSLNNPGANRLLYFIENLGYPLDIYFSEEEIAAYHAYFVEAFGQKIDEMSSYPATGYAQYVADEELGLECLIVKLGQN